jgi:hypothetical protein
MGLRGIEPVTGVNHNTILNWVKLAAQNLPNAPQSSEIPQITEIDELQTFAGSKKKKVWIWSAIDHGHQGILSWVIGDTPGRSQCCHFRGFMVKDRSVAVFLVCHRRLPG